MVIRIRATLCCFTVLLYHAISLLILLIILWPKTWWWWWWWWWWFSALLWAWRLYCYQEIRIIILSDQMAFPYHHHRLLRKKQHTASNGWNTPLPYLCHWTADVSGLCSWYLEKAPTQTSNTARIINKMMLFCSVLTHMEDTMVGNVTSCLLWFLLFSMCELLCVVVKKYLVMNDSSSCFDNYWLAVSRLIFFCKSLWNVLNQMAFLIWQLHLMTWKCWAKFSNALLHWSIRTVYVKQLRNYIKFCQHYA